MNNDLISREALKEKLNKKALDLANGGMIFIESINHIIDNAPTVESDILYLCDHKKCGENFNCYECNHTSDIRHAINFDLMELPRSVFVERARPQGECAKCTYRIFTEKFSDSIAEVMAQYGITTIEELQARLQEEMRGKADQLRDCENCVHHIDGKGCESWECEFKKRSDV